MTNLPVYSISKIGNCARTHTAERLGLLPKEEPNPRLMLAAREGQRHEQWIKDDLMEHGWKSIATKPVRCEPCNRDGYHIELAEEAFKMTGHMDDLVYPLGQNTNIHLAEYKALGRFSAQKILTNGIYSHRTYATQVNLYHYITNLPILYVIKNRDTGEMDVMELDPTQDYETIIERLYMIEDYASRGDLAPCDWKVA